jgi:hypothetical protein
MITLSLKLKKETKFKFLTKTFTQLRKRMTNFQAQFLVKIDNIKLEIKKSL